MLTSAGRSRRISESTALGVGSMMSIRRLWVRISKCSRLSLYLWGDRMTHTTFFSVGRGTGPTTVAPARVTVSTILRADESRPAWSYDFRRMRIFCPAIVCSLSFRVLPARAPRGHWTHSGAHAPWHFHQLLLVLLHRCSAVNPDAEASGSVPTARERTLLGGSWFRMFRSAARGLGCRRFRTRLCTALAVIRTHAERGAGMWNLTSLRAARACRKLGRVAQRSARQVHRVAARTARPRARFRPPRGGLRAPRPRPSWHRRRLECRNPGRARCSPGVKVRWPVR